MASRKGKVLEQCQWKPKDLEEIVSEGLKESEEKWKMEERGPCYVVEEIWQHCHLCQHRK